VKYFYWAVPFLFVKQNMKAEAKIFLSFKVQ